MRPQLENILSTATVVTSMADPNTLKGFGENALAESNQSFHDAPSSPQTDVLDSHCEGGDLAPMESTLLYDLSTSINDGVSSE